jgi:hypothetical protein
VILVGHEVTNLVQGEPECLRLFDESHTVERRRRVYAKAAAGARRRGKQSEALVIANRVRCHAASGCKLADLVCLTGC